MPQDNTAPAKTPAPTFTGDGEIMRLVYEAYRISLAHLFEPYLAVHSSNIEPLPHQISAVYDDMLPRMPLRYILADDPGAGKTIMTGLYLKELFMRGDLKHCLIVSPGSLAEQWQDELHRKFHMNFSMLADDTQEYDYCIARLDKLARNKTLQQKLQSVEWDVIVIDEAHKMSASVTGSKIRYTKRFRLGRLLSGITRHFLLLTATPHNGKAREFQVFMSLIDPDRFEGAAHSNSRSFDVSDVMRRLLKEELRRFDGTPLFPERIAYTLSYRLSPPESELYDEVTDYVREEFNRADRLKPKRRNTVGFALTILQRRLASSPEAIYQSLARRRRKLQERLLQGLTEDYSLYGYDADEDTQQEQTEDYAAGYVSAAETEQELQEEISTLIYLEEKARAVRNSGDDRKWNELSSLLQDKSKIFSHGEKLIIFTEHRDTLTYLYGRICTLLGDSNAAVCIHGGMNRDKRRDAEYSFMNDDNVRILIATDAAGEGINLQRAHLMVNYDIPWNPNRLEQRFGRIHRIGQKEVCHLWNLIAGDTREGSVFQRLFTKLETEREALGGKVFDVLGRLNFSGKSLAELLIEAIRHGNDPSVRRRLNESVDSTLTHGHLKKILDERALTHHIIDIPKIRDDITRTDTRRLQPYFTEAFFTEAFSRLGGRIFHRGRGIYEITFVPSALTELDSRIKARYQRVCFSKNFSSSAELIAPGHELLKAVSRLMLARYSDILRQGAVFIDDTGTNTEARLLFCIEDTVQDGTNITLSKHIHFIEITQDGRASDAGCAPYIDYRPASHDEQEQALSFSLRWSDPEASALRYAQRELIPAHVQEVRRRKLALTAKTERAVRERLTAEIQYHDFRASELKDTDITQAKNEELKADELEARMIRRLEHISTEKIITSRPPVIIGVSMVIPSSLITYTAQSRKDRKSIELQAMRAIMDIERDLGYIPHDVSNLKCGYDIESEGGNHVRFIEVKGRIKGADTVTVTAGEIRAGLNSPDNFILALAEIEGENTHVTYIMHPFNNAPDFSVTSINYDIEKLIQQGQVIHTCTKN